MIEFTDLAQQTTPYILNHQAQKRGDKPFLRMIGPDFRGQNSITYGEMELRTRKLANGLKALGIGKGDRVVIYMPMSIEGVCAMQACARIGATHSVVCGGFSAKSLLERLVAEKKGFSQA